MTVSDTPTSIDAIRVAIDAGPLYGHRTGVGVAADGMITALDELDGVEPVPYLVSGRSTPRRGHRRLPVPGAVASHLWSRSEHPTADRWLGGADVVHGTNYVVPPTRIPAVVSVYDCWFLEHPEQASPLVRRAGRNLRRAVERGAWIHTSSEATEQAARRLLGTDRVATVPLGPPDPMPDASVAPSDGLQGARYLLAIGTEERRKGLPLLVDAYAALQVEHPDLQLVLAGSRGDDSAAVDDAIARVDDASRVRRLGQVDDAAKGWLLRHAAVLAYPSLDEGFGFPVLEAQMVGTPVVATAVGSIPEVAGSAATLVDDRSPDAFGAAIDEALRGTGRLAIIEAGYRNVKRFDWSVTAVGLVDLYRRAIDSAS